MALSKILENSIAAGAVASSKLKDFTAAVDLNGVELVLDADGNTSITADTNDQIDFKIAGADDFRFTANTFTALAGSGIVVPDGGLTFGSTAISATAAEINLIDGGASTGTTAVADADGIITNDGGTMRLTTAATFKTYFQEGISTAYDDLTAGDAAVLITTSSGNITIDAAASDSDIILKGTDGGADTTFLTIDGSAAGEATFNAGIVIADAGNIGSASDKDAIAISAGGVVTMNQIPVLSAGLNVSGGTIAGTIATATQNSITTMTGLTTSGALDAGSITSGFGTIDTGSSTITTTGLISGGSLDIDNVLINGTTIGHTDDTDLMTVANGLLTVAGEVQMTTLDIGGTNVTATAAELNFVDGVTSNVQTQMNTKTTKGFAIASAIVFG